MKTVRCPQCNLVCWNTVINCNRCGFDMRSFIENETAAESESAESFERNVYENSAQNFGSQYRQQSENYAGNMHGGRAGQQETTDYRTDNRSTYNNRGENSRNYRTHNQNASQTNGTKKGLAIASLVLGILGMPWFTMLVAGLLAVLLSMVIGTAGLVIGLAMPFLIPVVALISGIVSLKRANRQPREFGGKGLAIAGICCSGFSLLIIPIVAAIAIPNLLAARRSANEGSAISSIKTLASAEDTLRRTRGTACGDLNVLGSNQLIDTVLKSGEKNGYRFVITKLPTPNIDCAITATPVSDSTGNRAFYFSTEDGEIRARKFAGKMADMNDEPIN